MAEEEPGMPMSTAEIKVPDTPPIQMASSMTKEVSVERPKVMGSSRAMPRVADKPGIAPKTMPSATMAKISSRFSGFMQTSKAERYAAIYFPSLAAEQNAGGQFDLERKDEHCVEHSRDDHRDDDGGHGL